MERPCFSHDQLYVAFSGHVASMMCMFKLNNQHSYVGRHHGDTYTRNIVYNQVIKFVCSCTNLVIILT